VLDRLGFIYDLGGYSDTSSRHKYCRSHEICQSFEICHRLKLCHRLDDRGGNSDSLYTRKVYIGPACSNKGRTEVIVSVMVLTSVVVTVIVSVMVLVTVIGGSW